MPTSIQTLAALGHSASDPHEVPTHRKHSKLAVGIMAGPQRTATKLLLLAMLSVACCARVAPQVSLLRTVPRSVQNEMPIIGILSQSGLKEDTFLPEGYTYIASSYIKVGRAPPCPVACNAPLLMRRFPRPLHMPAACGGMWVQHGHMWQPM